MNGYANTTTGYNYSKVLSIKENNKGFPQVLCIKESRHNILKRYDGINIFKNNFNGY